MSSGSACASRAHFGAIADILSNASRRGSRVQEKVRDAEDAIASTRERVRSPDVYR
jgi:hypothetical protein